MRRIFAGLAVASLVMLGISSGAHAQQTGVITCDEGGNPPNQPYDGALTITSSGSCTLSESVTASGSITVTASGPVNIIGGLTGNGVEVESTGGTVTVAGPISSSAFIWLYGKDATNTNYSPVNITSGASLSRSSELNIQGSDITSGIPLDSASITSHGGGTVNVVD
ncbi:MAG: hypothetical protein P4L53_28170 [Candidatus Obscuribacterales bacterium]|nr:hypothetical protein [Candidatus Obscuribacterales bacterium]